MIKKMDHKIQNLGTDEHKKIVHIHETEEVYMSGSNHGSVYGGSSYKGSQRSRQIVRKTKTVHKHHIYKDVEGEMKEKHQYYKNVEGEMEEVPAQNEQDSREFEEEEYRMTTDIPKQEQKRDS